MNHGDYIKGIYQPRITKDLKERAKRLIGKEYIFSYGWIIEEGKYKGQIALIPYHSQSIRSWIPSEDLTLTKILNAEDIGELLSNEVE